MNKFPESPLKVSMLKYATDKPDLRNPLEIFDLTNIFERDDVKFEIFKKLVKSGSIVRAIVTKNTKISQEVFLIILINGQNQKVHLDLHILLLNIIKLLKQKDQLENSFLLKHWKK